MGGARNRAGSRTRGRETARFGDHRVLSSSPSRRGLTARATGRYLDTGENVDRVWRSYGVPPAPGGFSFLKLHFPQSLVIIIELNVSSSHGCVSELDADAVVLFSQATRSASRASTRSPSSSSTRLRCAAWPTLCERRRRRARSLQPRWVSCVDQGDEEQSRDTASCGNTACCAQPTAVAHALFLGPDAAVRL